MIRPAKPWLCVIAILSLTACSIAADSGVYVFRHVTVIDGTGKPARPNMLVRVSAGRIQSVEPDSADVKTAGATLIDGASRFLIPGLWDAHVHLSDIGEVAIPILPTYGITSVRDMGGDPEIVMRFRDRIAKGELLGPRVKFCGPMLEGKWEQKPGGRTDHWVVAAPTEARPMVDKLARLGVDCIKMRSYASAETFFALAAAAREHNLPFGGHAPWGVDPIAASNAGYRSFEHAYYPWPWNTIAPDRKLEIKNAFRKNGSLVVPTLIAWETFRFDVSVTETVVNDYAAKSDPRLRQVSPSLRKNWLSGVEDLKTQHPGTPGWNKAIDDLYEQVAEMHDHGVGMMAGTDTGATLVYPGAALHQELKLLVSRCRFTPMDALLAATIIPAKYFNMEADLGTIQPGKLADMVLLSDDPLTDIGNIRKIDGVMLNGKWLDRAALDAVVRQTENAIKLLYASEKAKR
jgi:hypothetical protein